MLDLFHRFRRLIVCLARVEIVIGVHRDEMVVEVRNVKSCYDGTDSDTSGGLFECGSELLGGVKDCGVERFGYVHKIVYLYLGDHERMSEGVWTNIQECKRPFVFIKLVTRNFASDDTRKKRGHVRWG
jgi:hypothetical protein